MGGQIFEERQEPPILNIRRLRLQLPLYLLQVVKHLLRLLQVVLIRRFEDTPFPLLIVKEAQFHLDIHGILEFLYALLHGAEIGRKVGL